MAIVVRRNGRAVVVRRGYVGDNRETFELGCPCRGGLGGSEPEGCAVSFWGVKLDACGAIDWALDKLEGAGEAAWDYLTGGDEQSPKATAKTLNYQTSATYYPAKTLTHAAFVRARLKVVHWLTLMNAALEDGKLEQAAYFATLIMRVGNDWPRFAYGPPGSPDANVARGWIKAGWLKQANRVGMDYAKSQHAMDVSTPGVDTAAKDAEAKANAKGGIPIIPIAAAGGLLLAVKLLA